MKTPPGLAPFNLANWQAGWKAVYRDGTEPAGVVVIDNPIYPFISVGKRGESIWHLSSGECGGGQEGKRDLFLIQPEGQA